MKADICVHCKSPMVEYSRNEHYVFYKCACNRNKGTEWDWKNRLLNDVEYMLGSAGSFIHECPNCMNHIYRRNISNELCLWCREANVYPLTKHQSPKP